MVLHHLGLRLPLHKTGLADWLPVSLLKGIIYTGYEAVFVFFVISGFLIARHTLERSGTLDRVDVRAFYVRRVARIPPCLAGALVSALTFTLNLYESRTGYPEGFGPKRTDLVP